MFQNPLHKRNGNLFFNTKDEYRNERNATFFLRKWRVEDSNLQHCNARGERQKRIKTINKYEDFIVLLNNVGSSETSSPQVESEILPYVLHNHKFYSYFLNEQWSSLTRFFQIFTNL